MPNLYRLREYAGSMEEQEPLLFLPCGHCYTLSSLDGHVHLSEYYTHNEAEPPGMYPPIVTSSNPFSGEIRDPFCPTLSPGLLTEPLYFSCPTILKAVDSSKVNKKHL
jgi:hypothetical protein